MDEVLGDGWTGTMNDVLTHPNNPADAKIWMALLCGELSDDILNDFADGCKTECLTPGLNEEMSGKWKLSVGSISPAQERALACAVRSLRVRNGIRMTTLSDAQWQVTLLLSLLP